MPSLRAAAVLASLVPVGLVAACFGSSSSPGPSGGDQDAAPTADAAVPFDAPAGPDAVATVDAGSDAGGPATPDADAASPIPDATFDAPATDAVADAHVYESLGALSFDGVSDWVHLPAAAGGASVTAFTVELWFRATANTGTMFEVYGSGGADRFISLNGGEVCFYVFGSTVAQPCTATAIYADSAWHHAAGTLGAGGTNLYVDGVLAASDTTITSSTFTTDTDFRLGYGHTAYVSTYVYFQGDIDEVRLWSVERSAADIAANYQHTVDPTTAGLQGYWKLDETGSAMTTADATGNGNDGVLTNFSYTPSPWISPGAF